MSGPSGGIGSGGGLQQIMALRQQIIDRSQLLQQVRTPDPASPAVGAPPTEGAGGGFGGALKSALDSVNEAQNRAAALSEGYDKGEVTDKGSINQRAVLKHRDALVQALHDGKAPLTLLPH